jgi:hypothetical protein
LRGNNAWQYVENVMAEKFPMERHAIIVMALAFRTEECRLPLMIKMRKLIRRNG